MPPASAAPDPDDVLFYDGAPLRAGQPLPMSLRSDETKEYEVHVRPPPGKGVENIRVISNVPAEFVDATAPPAVRGSPGTIVLRVHGRPLFDAPPDVDRILTTFEYDIVRRFG